MDDAEKQEGDLKVSTLELFFDLVFVFTITQLTSVLVAEPNGVGLARMVLLLGIIWWMYGGYAWLTNAVPPVGRGNRGILVLAMIAYFVLALSIPNAFTETRWIFAATYLIIVLIHLILFLRSNHAGNRQGIFLIIPWNIPGSLLLFAAAATQGSIQWIFLALAPLLFWGRGIFQRPGEFLLHPAHFVERHGLVLLIALGESVINLGAGLAGESINLDLIVTVILVFIVLTGLWWCYFSGDSQRLAEKRLAEAAPQHRATLSLNAYGYNFLLVLGGVIILAAGLKETVSHPLDRLALPPAIAVGGGVAIYLLSNVVLRTILNLGSRIFRLFAFIVAIASSVVGVTFSALAQLGTLATLFLLLIALENAFQRARSPAVA